MNKEKKRIDDIPSHLKYECRTCLYCSWQSGSYGDPVKRICRKYLVSESKPYIGKIQRVDACIQDKAWTADEKKIKRAIRWEKEHLK